MILVLAVLLFGLTLHLSRRAVARAFSLVYRLLCKLMRLLRLVVRRVLLKPVALFYEAMAGLLEHQRRFRDDQLPLLADWSALAANYPTNFGHQLHDNGSDAAGLVRPPKAFCHRAPGTRRYNKKPNHHIA